MLVKQKENKMVKNLKMKMYKEENGIMKYVETFVEVIFNNDSASDYDEAMDKVEEYRTKSWAIDTDDCEEGIRTIRLIKCDEPILTN